MASNRKYDAIIYGASGFTGQYVVQEFAIVQQGNKNKPQKWAVAGRTRAKLKQVLENATKITGIKLQDVDIVIADTNDENSLRQMCAMTRIVLNCVGPYRFHGEKVVKNAVEQGCHHVDISGEPQFLEEMELKYHEKAKAANVYVVGSCGADSIPADIGTKFTRDSFSGQLGVVDCYINLNSGPKGIRVNYGTWESAVHGLANANKLRKLRKEANAPKLPKAAKPVIRRGSYFESKEVQGYGIPFMGADHSVVQRTLRYLYQEKNLQPFPGLFSNGYFRRGGPSQEQIDGTSFSLTFYGYGFKDKNKSSVDAIPDTRLVTKVSGPEPGYVATPICMVQAAMCILEEADSLPNNGGVYTPGAAFQETNIVARLHERGLKFSIIEEPSQFDKKIS